MSDGVYEMLDEVPDSIKFFCATCCLVLPNIMETSIVLDNLLSSVNEKLNIVEEKFSKSLDNVGVQLSNQLKEIESKLQGFESNNQLSRHLKEIESKLHEPNTTLEQHLKYPLRIQVNKQI